MITIDLATAAADSGFLSRVYLVTGAASGIGRSLALELAGLGATVILLDKDEARLEQIHDQVIKSGKGEPIIVHQDLTLLGQEHCDSLLDQVRQACGRLDGMIHCAVETGHLAPIEHYREDDWSCVIRANLHAPYLLTRTFMPLLDAGHPGRVIFSATEQAVRSSAYWGGFAVAQQGLKALVQTWADEKENGKSSLALLDPGKTNTPFLVRLYPGLNAEQFQDSNAAAQAYLHLLSTREHKINGRFFRLDRNRLSCLDCGPVLSSPSCRTG